MSIIIDKELLVIETDEWKMPKLLKAEDGTIYYYKHQYPRNVETEEFINLETNSFNEVFACVIGQYLGLPIPNYKFVYQKCDNDYLYGCVSEFVKDAFGDWLDYSFDLMQRGLKDTECIVNKQDFIKMYLFDRLIANTDRGDWNIMLQHLGGNNYKLIMIDHHYAVLGGDNRPHIATYINHYVRRKEIEYKYFPDLLEFINNNLDKKVINEFIEKITSKEFTSYLENMRSEFLECGPKFITSDEYTQAIELIRERAILMKEHGDIY